MGGGLPRPLACLIEESLLNDDAAMRTDGWETVLTRALLGSETRGYGVLSLEVDGGVGNPLQNTDPQRAPGSVTPSDAVTVAFVAALIRRAVWDSVGELDERFVGYGYEDDDYCRRTRLAGWRCGVLAGVRVIHGWEQFAHSASYRQSGGRGYFAASELNRKLFEAKWGS